VSHGYEQVTVAQFCELVTGEASWSDRLRTAARWAVATPFFYPGRGRLAVFLVSDGERVRMSEGGHLLRFLESQGMDMSLDVVISKTVFHAVQECPGMAIGAGQVSLDSTPDQLAADLARFVQMVVEIVGLRHSKYKDAIVQLARRSDALQAAAAGAWEPS